MNQRVEQAISTNQKEDRNAERTDAFPAHVSPPDGNECRDDECGSAAGRVRRLVSDEYSHRDSHCGTHYGRNGGHCGTHYKRGGDRRERGDGR